MIFGFLKPKKELSLPRTDLDDRLDEAVANFDDVLSKKMEANKEFHNIRSICDIRHIEIIVDDILSRRTNH